MKVVVTGAGGMLGSDVVRASSAAGHEVAGFAHAELDITDERAVTARLEAERPDAVVNCAAWTDVDGAESDPGGAMRVNAAGADVLAAVAERLGASIGYPSNDYVLGGSKREPY